MRDFFAYAKEDLERARALNPNLIEAYVDLAAIARATSDRGAVERVLKAGLAIAPESVSLHSEFLMALEPKWLGEPGETDSYLAALKKRFPRVAALGLFQGYADFETGGQLLDSGNTEEALARFDRALAVGPRVPDFLWLRALALYNLHRYDEAAADMERALAIWPQSGDYHLALGRARAGQQRGPEALASLDRAIAYDRLNPEYLYWRAWVLRSLGRYDEGMRDLDAAMTYGAYDLTIQDERNFRMPLFAARQDEAVAASRRETELFPEHSVAWLRYAEALTFKKDCKAYDALQLYRELCKRDGGCDAVQGSILETLPYMHCGKI